MLPSGGPWPAHCLALPKSMAARELRVPASEQWHGAGTLAHAVQHCRSGNAEVPNAAKVARRMGPRQHGRRGCSTPCERSWGALDPASCDAANICRWAKPAGHEDNQIPRPAWPSSSGARARTPSLGTRWTSTRRRWTGQKHSVVCFTRLGEESSFRVSPGEVTASSRASSVRASLNVQLPGKIGSRLQRLFATQAHVDHVLAVDDYRRHAEKTVLDELTLSGTGGLRYS